LKICEDLEEVEIAKVFQIRFPTSTNFPGFFLIFLAIFPAREINFRVYLNWRNSRRWGPPIGLCVTTRHPCIG
jgi:hypothetical protein